MRDTYNNCVEHGASFPFDALTEWWDSNEPLPPPPARNWQHKAARGIFSSMRDRRGIKQELAHYIFTEFERASMVESLATLIRDSVAPITEGNHVGLGRQLVEKIRTFGSVNREFETVDSDVMDDMYDEVGRIVLAAQALGD